MRLNGPASVMHWLTWPNHPVWHAQAAESGAPPAGQGASAQAGAAPARREGVRN